MKSLDPRVNRLPQNVGNVSRPKGPLDQFNTFEVFVQPKAGKPFQHEGAVHAPNTEMAFILAKENFTRRFTCISLWVAETRFIHVSPTTEGGKNVYDLLDTVPSATDNENYEIFHLLKRGKQHVHFQTVEAASHDQAMSVAKKIVEPNAIFYNVWSIRTRDIRSTSIEEADLWLTLPEKKFRDAAAYKGGDKLKEYLEKNQPQA